MLQNRASLPPGWSLAYYSFDLLHLNGAELMGHPLKERREMLETLLSNSGVLLSQTLPGTLKEITAAVRQQGLEGIVAKHLDSKYQPGKRSDFWLKHPLKPKQDFVIGGYRMEGKRLELFLVGYFEKGKSLFASKVHQGLNPVRRDMLLKTLQQCRHQMSIRQPAEQQERPMGRKYHRGGNGRLHLDPTGGRGRD